MAATKKTTRNRTQPSGGPLFGAHLSIAGGMHHAVERAVALNCPTVQVFVKNQRQWAAAPLQLEAIEAWKAAQPPGFGPVVAHATYLINLAAADEALWEKSCVGFATELERCDALGIAYLVVHPGAAGDRDRPDALARVAEALNAILTALPKVKTMPLLEITAGQGSTLGVTFTELHTIIKGLQAPKRVGVCVDTCHVFASGYDIRSADGYAAMLDEIENTVGMSKIRCWHLNDSKGGLGSRLDRHAHIGDGQIGLVGFRRIVNDERFAGQPMILETPHDTDADGNDMIAVDLDRLRKLRS
jgi:deoxyribonuclease-4